MINPKVKYGQIQQQSITTNDALTSQRSTVKEPPKILIYTTKNSTSLAQSNMVKPVPKISLEIGQP